MKRVNRAYRFRLYPNKAQGDLLARHFGCVRFIYNYFLNQRDEQYKANGKSDNYCTQAKALTILKNQESASWLKDVNSQSLQFALKCLESSYTKFFNKKSKHPRFKSKRSKNSFTVPQCAYIDGNRLFIRKFGEGIKCRVHREIKGKIGKVTITKTPSGKYFASILTKEEYDTLLKKTNKSVGVDMGLKDLLVTSEGEVFKNNKYTRKYRNKLKVAQQHLSRKVKGSKGFENQRLKVARLYEKIVNSRDDYLHKCSISLVQRYDIIYVEDLNVKDMEQNHHLAESIADASWSRFVTMLTYKANWNDKKVIKIDRYFPSSQTCGVCGYVNPETKNLSVRKWECPNCHTKHDRDINAAINILHFGLNKTSAGSVDYMDGEDVKSSMKSKAHRPNVCG